MSKRAGLRYVQSQSGVRVVYGFVATKYGGFVKSYVVSALCIKYDGYVEAEVIYNFVISKFHGYVESSILIE